MSNLVLTLRTLQYLAPQAKISVLIQEREKEHINKLLDLFPVHAVLTFPVTDQAMLDKLQDPA